MMQSICNINKNIFFYQAASKQVIIIISQIISMETSTRPAITKFDRSANEQWLDLTNMALGKKYIIFDFIRKNDHCSIYTGIDKESKEERTFKFYNLKEIQAQRSFRQKQVCKRISNYEYEVLHKCKSINILKCFDIYEDQSYKVLVYEFCNKGSLKDQISKRQFKPIDEIRAIIILKQIINALKSLHENCQILHKNLKSNKIMISNGVYKIIDFGFPKVMDAEDEDKNDNFIVPEIIRNHYYDSKAQVWSLGVLFHQILLGSLPVSCQSRTLLFSQMKKSRSALNKTALIELDYSSEVIDFLQKCLMFEPEARMNWVQLERHPVLMNKLIEQEKPIKSYKRQTIRQQYISTLLSIQDQSQGNHQFEEDPFYHQKFNLEKEKRDILKQIQKSYVKHGLPFIIDKLDNASIYSMKMEIHKDQENLYISTKLYYQSCLRVEFVLRQIIKPTINMLSVLGDIGRQEIEFMYLLICRCFFEISHMNSQMNSQLQKKSQYCSILMKCVKKLTNNVYSEIKELMTNYALKLTQSESKWRSVISDKFASWLKSSESKQRDRFFVGIEVMDYQKQQQIDYTIKRYEQINNKLTVFLRNEENKDQNIRKRIQYLQTYMSIYKEIWNSQSDKIEQYPTIKCFIDRVLLKNNR